MLGVWDSKKEFRTNLRLLREVHLGLSIPIYKKGGPLHVPHAHALCDESQTRDIMTNVHQGPSQFEADFLGVLNIPRDYSSGNAQKRNPKISGTANARKVDLQDNPPATNHQNRANAGMRFVPREAEESH